LRSELHSEQGMADLSVSAAAPSVQPVATRLIAILLAAGISLLTLLLWVVPVGDVQTHNLLHHLNFIPLVSAGMLLGWRGAAATMLFTFLLQGPHILYTGKTLPVYALDQTAELSIFSLAGIITGFLSDRERGQRIKLERTTRELEGVHHELQQNVDRLRKAERLSAAGQLSAGLAHEIRNPLASIAGAAGILTRGHASTENFQECLEIIEKESQRLNRLLTSFLDFARPRAPRFQLTDVRAVIGSVALLAAHATGTSAIAIGQQADPDLPEIECDPEQLKQVLLNLVINAIQATPDQGQVRLHASHSDNRICIAVHDEGCGIAPELSDQLFDPFFTTKEQGTGLGLAVASKIIEQHGGLLTAQNNVEKGMTFRIELPLDRSRAL